MTWDSDQPHDVYWLYDAEGRVLYIGCTRQLTRRLTEHSKHQEWWPRIARIEVEGYADKPAAIKAERHAIYTERPIFNKQVVVPNRLPPIIRRGEPIHAVESAAS